MKYSVEVQIMRRDIDRAGERKAIEAAVLHAWTYAVREVQPKRSIVLIATEIDEYLPPGPYAYRYRFQFEVD